MVEMKNRRRLGDGWANGMTSVEVNQCTWPYIGVFGDVCSWEDFTSYFNMSTISKSSKMLGVSQPISIAQPTQKDILQTAALMQTLKGFNSFEPKEETEKRVTVIKKLSDIINTWIKMVTASRVPKGSNLSAEGKLMAFGSYRLGVHSSGGDIDSVLIAPRYVSRSDFFTSLKSVLSADPLVKSLNAVEHAYVPLMTMEYDSVEVDLLFARMDLATIPNDLDLTNNSLLKNLDQESVRSLNGVRVCEKMLQLVPNPESFRLALRAIKIWAKNHGIYSNAMGFFGGITWAILVARTCQLYPNASASTLVQKVFFVFASWDWKSPVLLDFLSNENSGMIALDNMVWGRKYADRFHLMPILTPCFPEQNSTHNVTRSTKQVIESELKNALETCKDIQNGKATWNDLMEETNFFSRYKHFVSLQMDAKTETAKNGYAGFLESRIRKLVTTLERNHGIQIAHANPKMFKCVSKTQSVWFIGLEFTDVIKNLDLTPEIQNFKKTVDEQAKMQSGFGDVQLEISYVKRANLIKIIPAAELKRGKFYVVKKVAEVEKENCGGMKRSCQNVNVKSSMVKRSVLKSIAVY
ncbi:unnamed protein product [Caenorhabditis brenneri]